MMVGVVRTLIDLGFEIISTKGTAEFLKAQGLEVRQIKKVLEGRPNILDAIKNNEIALVINTTEGKQSLADSFSIRRTTLMMKIPYYTTATGALAASQAISALTKGGLQVRALQDYD
jgi:carbamoyl-phosphate synthase large subunit